jgi:hypothetical protein
MTIRKNTNRRARVTRVVGTSAPRRDAIPGVVKMMATTPTTAR